MKIKLLRLVSGEEIIAEIANTDEETYLIKDAIVMIPAGEGRIGFMPFMPYTEAKDGLTIRKQDVMFSVDPIKDMVDQFRQARSGIEIPNKGIIKG